MSNDEKFGRDFAKGFFGYLAPRVLVAFGAVSVITFLLNAFDVGTDSTDRNGFNRSGLRLHQDAKTGIEYLSTRNGGLTRRASQ